MSFLSTKGAEGASFLWGAEQASAGSFSQPSSNPAGGVGSFQLQRRDESSKQEMVTRRREQPNDLQLSSQKEKKKKSLTIAKLWQASLKGRLVRWYWGLGTNWLKAYCVPRRFLYIG